MAEPTRVVNRRREREDVYIGRGSLYGNPFVAVGGRSTFVSVVAVATREDAIERYRAWLHGDVTIAGWTPPTPAQIRALRGKRLGCYCAPLACHGQVLAELADAGDDAPPPKGAR